MIFLPFVLSETEEGTGFASVIHVCGGSFNQYSEIVGIRHVTTH
jgi:hypothetical protein